MGLAQYYSQYMRNFADVAFQLTDQMKVTLTRRIVWSEDMIRAFDALKRELLCNIVLDIADPSKDYVLETDASDYAVGGVLSQYNASQELRPVAFLAASWLAARGRASGPGVSVRRKRMPSYSCTSSSAVGWRPAPYISSY